MLTFPNASRSYDAGKQGIGFRGYDSVFEVAFHVEEIALHAMSTNPDHSQSALLALFDANRTEIERVAKRAYYRRKAHFLRLTASDFS